MCSAQPRLFPLPLALLITGGLCHSSSAQTPLHVQFAQNPGVNYFGDESATSLGDVDGDGVPDYAVGARADGATPGYVVVFSGGTGQSLATLTGTGTWDQSGGSDRFGRSIAGVGDINGDQIPDLLVGASEDDTYGINKGAVLLFSGSDWSVLRLHPPISGLGSFGTEVGPLGDVNGDGVPEYLVAERQESVYCFNGADGTVLWSHQAPYWDYATNLSPTVGDANGDGVPDVLIGAMSYSFGSNPPHTLVLDGKNGSLLHTVGIGTTKSTYFGRHVGWIGDLNGDQRCEFAVGAPGVVGGGTITVFDGATGAALYNIAGGTYGAIGDHFCGLGDQNGDGVPDLAAADGGVARLHSGVDGSLLHTYDTTPMVDHKNGTRWLAPAGDLDGDGKLELMNSTYSNSGIAAGAVVVFSSTTYPLTDVGHALAGAAGDPALVAEGNLEGGSVLRLSLSNAWTWTPAILVIGLTPLNAPFMGGTLVPSPHVVLWGLNTGPSGKHDLWLPIVPGIPSQLELYMQYWMDGGHPTSVTASNAVKGIFP